MSSNEPEPYSAIPTGTDGTTAHGGTYAALRRGPCSWPAAPATISHVTLVQSNLLATISLPNTTPRRRACHPRRDARRRAPTLAT